MTKEKLFLVDAYALIYRGYYALGKNPRLTSKGQDTSAILGFLNSLLDIIKREKPVYMAVVFDLGEPFRCQQFPQYKANRESTPEPIKWGTPHIKEILMSLGITIIEKTGYEADDLIGTIAKKAEKEDFQIFMISPDKDFCQLVSENIFLYKPARMGNQIEIMGVEEVLNKYDFDKVEQMIDFLAMMGDSSDNIPGIPGVGEKTAKKFIKKYKSLENLLNNTQDIEGKLGEKINQNIDLGILSKKLVTIDINSPIEFDRENFKIKEPDLEKIKNIFEKLEFKRSLVTVQNVFFNHREIKNQKIQTSLFDNDEEIESKSNNIKNTSHHYQLVETPMSLELLLKNLLKQKEVCFDTETTSLNFLEAELVGISFSWEKNKGFYIPFGTKKDQTIKTLEILSPFFQNGDILKIGHNLKYDIHILNNYDIDVRGPFYDTLIAHYLINSDMKQDMDTLSETYLNYIPIPIETLIGKGKTQINMREVDIEKQLEYAVEDTDVTLQLKWTFDKELKEKNLYELFKNVEIPLMEVIKDMEREGITIDKNYLFEISKKLEKEIIILEKDILELSGTDFSISSPKQLGEVLFDKMKIVESPKKTKTGQYSTSEDVLKDLENEHPIIRKILEWRTLQKLKTTYADTLPDQINKKSGRIHTNFNQVGAITGRLSSNNPNLQNIPIRTDWGEKIRRAFVKKNDDYVLLSADYSQIELRVMAELSKEENMIRAFQNKMDIHTDTASKIFKVEKNQVTKEQRANAKTVNFGIMYGVSAYGLSRQTNLNRKESQEMIDMYNQAYPNLKKFIKDQIYKAQKKGYVETIMGRKRRIDGINSNNDIIRKSAERNAINTPIQGSAADIIKLAMINIFREFKNRNLKSKMILQVHDELVFDVKKDELEIVKEIIKEKMENAVDFSIPLEVEMGIGDNWLDAH